MMVSEGHVRSQGHSLHDCQQAQTVLLSAQGKSHLSRQHCLRDQARSSQKDHVTWSPAALQHNHIPRHQAVRGSRPHPLVLHQWCQTALIHESHGFLTLLVQHGCHTQQSWPSEDLDHNWIEVSAPVNEIDLLQSLHTPQGLQVLSSHISLQTP